MVRPLAGPLAAAQNSFQLVGPLATWPNYHSQENLDAFAKTTGARVSMSVFGSNDPGPCGRGTHDG